MRKPFFRILYSCLCVTCIVLAGWVASSHFQRAAWADEASSQIVVRGSSILKPLVENWATTFGQKPGAPKFNIKSTGTSEGVAALLNGRANIALASRPMNPEELSAAREKGLAIQKTIVARMGIAVIVHRDNPVSSIAMNTLAEIFSGSLKNWQTVGGPEEPISVVRKESGWSPEFFRQRVMGDREFALEAVIVDSKEDVVTEVSFRPWSIGVTGMPEALPALDRISLVRLVSDYSNEDSTYALSRPLYLFTVAGSPPVQDFLDFVLKAHIQEMIVDTGLYPALQADPLSSDS